MNIFVLSENPETAARYHCNRHVVKMILESCQLLSSAHRVLDGTPVGSFTKNGRKLTRYKLTGKLDNFVLQANQVNNHLTLWTRACSGNYKWVSRLVVALCKEYRLRYGKKHSYEELATWLLKNPPANLKVGKRQTFRQAVAEDCKVPHNPVRAYRRFYRRYKAYFAKWTHVKIPHWYFDQSHLAKTPTKRGHAKHLAARNMLLAATG